MSLGRLCFTWVYYCYSPWQILFPTICLLPCSLTTLLQSVCMCFMYFGFFFFLHPSPCVWIITGFCLNGYFSHICGNWCVADIYYRRFWKIFCFKTGWLDNMDSIKVSSMLDELFSPSTPNKSINTSCVKWKQQPTSCGKVISNHSDNTCKMTKLHTTYAVGTHRRSTNI